MGIIGQDRVACHVNKWVMVCALAVQLIVVPL